jgi:hypothetical protein
MYKQWRAAQTVWSSNYPQKEDQLANLRYKVMYNPGSKDGRLIEKKYQKYL